MAILARIIAEDIAQGGRDVARVVKPSLCRALGDDRVIVHRGPLFADSLETRQKAGYEPYTSWFATRNEITACLPFKVQNLATFLEYGPGVERLYLPVTRTVGSAVLRRWMTWDQCVTEFTYILAEFEARRDEAP